MKTLRTVWIFVSVLAMATAAAQTGLYSMAPPGAGIGVYDTERNGALSFTANQAALARAKQFAAAVYGEKRFLLQELSLYHVAVVQPAGSGAFGLQVARQGDADFNTTKTGLGYGRDLGQKIQAGVQFNYWRQRLRGYGHTDQVSVEAGITVRFSEVLYAGAQVCNALGVAWGKENEPLSAEYHIGFGYQPAATVMLTTDLVKIEKQPLALQAAVQYRFASALWATAGFSRASFFVSAGFRLRDFTLEVSGVVHPQLGLSPGLLLLYTSMEK